MLPKATPTVTIESPLVIMFPQGGKIRTHIHPRKGDNYRMYGLLICDLIRHVARCFKIDEEDVFAWVEREFRRPTTDITNPS